MAIAVIFLPDYVRKTNQVLHINATNTEIKTVLVQFALGGIIKDVAVGREDFMQQVATMVKVEWVS